MEKLFTVVLAHYNQMKYIRNSIFSILMQDYRNIELIITDDASKDFNKEEIIKFIEKNKKENLKSYDFIINQKNLGTVKTLNKALKASKGDYIMFFAADDELFNLKVISNFVQSFEKTKENVITSQSYMYDNNLSNLFEKYVDKNLAYKINEMSAFEQYTQMAIRCIYSSGATAYKKEIFDKHGIFNEKYQIIEDWTFWLKILRAGEKMLYVDFPTLKHRDGGVSHNNSKLNELPPHVIKYYKDILKAYNDEVMPYISKFEPRYKVEIIDRYIFHIEHFTNLNEDIKREYLKHKNDFFEFYNLSKKDYDRQKQKLLLENKIKNFVRWQVLDRFITPLNYNNILLLTFVLWLEFMTKLPEIYNIININTFSIFSTLIFSICFIILKFMNNYNKNIPYCFTITTLITGMFSTNITDYNKLIAIFICVYIICLFSIEFTKMLFKINKLIRKE